MGGLVIKKAYILARQFQEFNSLAQRIHAMFFLATPHRGADLAQLLTKILHVASITTPFVADLHRNSLATQSINDEFPQYCQDLQLYSFFETLPTNYGIGKSIIVDKDLATLGYRNERTQYLQANHRDICKYSTPMESNYLIVRNALASTVEKFRNRIVSLRRELDKEQRRLLDSFLGISDAPDDEFMSVDTIRMAGSCEWLTKKKKFQQWRDSPDTQLYWVNAKPATGKSVLSGFVIDHLKELSRDCVFYFFNHGDKVKSTISSFLRSMAWQMAFLQPSTLRTVLEICKTDDQLGKSDYRTIWRKLFIDGIFRANLDQPQYWVIDALDECKADSELVPLLLKVGETCPIRVLVTSRNRFDLYKQVLNPKISVIPDEILPEDTKHDISLYLQANMDHIPSISDEARQEMVKKILQKSAGCFLWVSLVLQELRQVHTSAEIRQVLNEVPSDMDELYSRILDSMSRAPYGKLLAKAIITWTVCAARPLTTHELHHALQIDINDSIDSVQKSITTSCGQLIYVDAQSRVQMVHQTARDFLLQQSTKLEFAIDKKLGHKRLAMACLQYLNGDEMKGPRHRKLSVSNVVRERCPFVTYASNSLFEHIPHVSSTDGDFLIALTKFLSSSNVLSWIEYIAKNSDLNRLIQTAKSFINYLQRRSKHMAPFGKEVVLVNSWATDLIRLVTKFGKYLSTSPSSIFHLIPPFCPPETAPKKQFAASTRGIAVHGLSATTWDDCLSTIVYQPLQASALACSNTYFAVGLSNGKILIYNEMTCQETQALQHQEPVKILKFGETGKLLASSGLKVVRVWDTSPWQQLWNFEIPQQCMSLAFTDDDRLLLGALKNNNLMFWDLTQGLLRDLADWTQDFEGQHAHAFRRPTTAAFGMELKLLAIVYRGQDILLWDLEREALHETYGKDTGARSEKGVSNATVWTLIFNPAPGATLLAAAYSDGDLVLFDTFDGTVKETTLANAQTLASSHDGRTLATGDSSGTIQIFDFETLKALYCIRSDDYGINHLIFSDDNNRLLDVRGSQCRVWDPVILVREDAFEEASDTISVSTAPRESILNTSEDIVLITALACHENGEGFYCGKEDGSVYLYESKSGRQSQKVFSHAKSVSVVSLCFDDHSYTMSSTDSSGRVMSHKLIFQQETWKAARVVFDHNTGAVVGQLLSNKGHTRLLVCSANKDTLWSITSDESSVVDTVLWEDRDAYRWENHPSNEDQLILVTDNVVNIYEWQTLRRLTGPEGILLEGTMIPELFIRSITPCFNNTVIATTFAESLRTHSKSKILLWNAFDFHEQSMTAAPIPRYRHLADQVESLIGAYGQRLVFLHSSGWICSADSESLNDGYARHFFIPADWLSTDSKLMIEVSRSGDIIFVKRDEVAVIQHGLENNEQGSSHVSGKRPSLTVPTISY